MAQEIVELETLSEVLDDLERRGITGTQRVRAVNGFVSLKARYRDIPVSGVFELTPLCNLDCRMCYVHLNAGQLREGERLRSVSEWKEITRQAAEAGMLYATLTGGECLTYPGFREVYLHLTSMGIQPDILTNGRLLTEDMVAFLAQHPPAVMQVSVYGSDEDAYERVTGHRAFQEVMQGIDRAKAAGLNLTLAITPNRFMQENAQALLELVRARRIPYAIGGSTLEAREETGRRLQDYAVEADRYAEIQRLEREYLANAPEGLRAKPVPRYVPRTRGELKGLPCGGAHSTFHVNWRGELCPCTGFSETVRSLILERGFKRAWDEVREAMLAYAPPQECGACAYRDGCVSCPAEKGRGRVVGRLNGEVCRRMKALAGERTHDNEQACLQND